MELHKLQELISKYNSGTATPDEQQTVENWYDSIAGDDSSLTEIHLHTVKEDIHAYLNTYISQKENPAPKVIPLRPKRRYQTWLAAAVVLFILSISSYFYVNRSATQLVAVKPAQLLKNDIAPGGNQAMLVLANGTRIVLNNQKNGKVASQGATQIDKSNDHLLVYDASDAIAAPAAGAPVEYNTLTTPRGGKYDLILPDGSKVCMNAESSLRFPTAFNGNDREVELTGEAYFEVTKNKNKPFKVNSAGQTVEVLGTHFNINAYANEPAVRTTLLEGSVQVTKGSNKVIIKPGQQAVANNRDNHISINPFVNTDEVVAWKNGMFQFNDADISTIMRQVSRWYDVDVQFESNIPADAYSGKISRNVNASQVLRILEISGVHFKIEGRKIIVK